MGDLIEEMKPDITIDDHVDIVLTDSAEQNLLAFIDAARQLCAFAGTKIRVTVVEAVAGCEPGEEN